MCYDGRCDMKIQGNMINSFNYRKSDKNKKQINDEKNKLIPDDDSSIEDEKAEAARIKKEELAAAAEELKKAAEEAKEQAEAKGKEARRFGVILEIFRRISRGDRVNPKDESALMEYDMKLYLSAKNAAQLAASKKTKQYKKSLIEGLEKAEKEKDLKKAEDAENDKASGEDSKTEGAEKSSDGAKESLGVSIDVSV
jgi:hypothetical protein